MVFDPFWQEIILATLQVMLPLVPSWVMYRSFGRQNFTKWGGVNKSIQLGGPIAAYFVIMITLMRFMGDVNPDLLNYIEKQQSTQQAYVGEWLVQARTVVSSGIEGEVPAVTTNKGKAYIRQHGYHLNINGVWQDVGGNIIGSWSADDLVVSDSKLIFLWQLETHDSIVGTLTGVGVLMATNTPEEQIFELRGYWGVLGGNQRGTIFWVRDLDILGEDDA